MKSLNHEHYIPGTPNTTWETTSNLSPGVWGCLRHHPTQPSLPNPRYTPLLLLHSCRQVFPQLAPQPSFHHIAEINLYVCMYVCIYIENIYYLHMIFKILFFKICVYTYTYAYMRLSDKSDIHEGFLAWGGAVVALPWVDLAIQICYAPAFPITLRNSCSSPSPCCQVLTELIPK